MSRNIHTVQDLWNEYTHGINGQQSVESLECDFGDIWRGGSKSSESKFYHGRMLIIKLVKEKI